MTDSTPKPKTAGIIVFTRRVSQEQLDEADRTWKDTPEDDRMIISWKWVRVLIYLTIATAIVDVLFWPFAVGRAVESMLAFWAGCVTAGKVIR